MASSAAMPTTGTPPPKRLPAWLLTAIMFAAVLAAYLPVWHAGFIWDDDSHLTANPCIVGPLGFAGIWTSAAGYYFPLVTTSLWLQHLLWGLAPAPYHVVDVLFHATGAVLLWLVLRRLRVRGAWLGAMLWALHPVQVESAAWISELKNTQSGVFYLLSIWCFLRWVEPDPPRERGRPRDYAFALLCAVLAILSKTSTVMLPVMLGLCWWWLRGRWRWRNALWLAPFLLVSAAAGAWTIWEQRYHSGALGPAWDQTLPQRVILSGRVFWFYLGKLLWPHPLIFIYPRWQLDASRVLSYLPVLAAVGGVGWLWWCRQGRLRPVFFAAAGFGVSLFPVLGFFNVYFFRYSFVGDHFQYLASMAALALAGAGLATVGGWLAPPRRSGLGAAPAALLLAGLGFLTWRQSRNYVTEQGLWRATIAADPQSWMAQNNLGGMLVKAGDYAAAIGHLETSLRLHPGIQEAEYNLGLALFRTNRPAAALPHYEEALRLKPGDPDIMNRIGDALIKLNRMPEAAARYEASLRLNPNDALAQNNLGVTLMQLGRAAAALPHFEAAVRLKPGYAEAENNLGNLLVGLGRTDEAIVHLEAAVRAQPGFSDAHYNLAVVLLSAGRMAEGAAQLQEAVRLTPNDTDAQCALGEALVALGRAREAIPHFQAALRVNPGLERAREGLALARQQLGP